MLCERRALPVSATRRQARPGQCGSSTTCGRCDALNAMYRPPPAPSPSDQATSREAALKSGAPGAGPWKSRPP